MKPGPAADPPQNSMDATSQPGIPGWTLLRSIGRGSYGEVWLARNPQGLHRAIKVVYRNSFDNDRPYERELSGIRRFEPLSQRHPSQVAIFNVSENPEAGYFYYVMELADDVSSANPDQAPDGSSQPAPFDPVTYRPRTLRGEASQRTRLPYRECLEIGLALATALEHLHQHGLVHRDIKPSNVIFVNGIPKLADIGLVTSVDASVSFVGTEGFLPPEGPGTPQADLYSLGKVLYEISTGQDRMDFPELPSFTANPAGSSDFLELNQILLKACQNDIRRRYQCASELLDDLRILHEGRSLRQTRAREKRFRRIRLAMVGACAVAALIAAIDHVVQKQRIQRIEQEKSREAEARETAQKLAANQSRRLADLYIANGASLDAQGDISGALVLYQRALATDPPDDGRAREHRSRIRTILERSSAPIAFVSDPTGIAFATFDPSAERVLSLSGQGRLALWDIANGQPISTLVSRSSVPKSVALAPGGDRALLILADGTAQLVQLNRADAVAQPIDSPGRVTRGFFNHSGGQFCLVVDESGIVVCETSSRRERFRLRLDAPVSEAAFSPNDALLAVVNPTDGVRLWSTESGTLVGRPMSLGTRPRHLAFSPDGRRLLSVGEGGIRLHDVQSTETSPVSISTDASILSASFSPDGRWLIAADATPSATLWDSITGTNMATFPHRDPIRAVQFSPDQRWIATATDRSIRLWNAAGFSSQSEAFVHGGRFRNLDFSRNGSQFLTLFDDGVARIYAVDQRLSADAIEQLTHTDEATARWARLVSGRELDGNEQWSSVGAKTLHDLRAEFSTLITQSTRKLEMATYHQEVAGTAEAEKQWFTAAYHWRELARLAPGSRTASDGIVRVQNSLIEAELTSVRPVRLEQAIPPRPANASVNQVDLGRFFNASLRTPWLPTGAAANDLGSLPSGLQKFNGVPFDVRGVIQLSGRATVNRGSRFPEVVGPMPVELRCSRLHFLHGAAWSSLMGTPVGSYTVHYEDGERRELKIIFGRHLREWWSLPTQHPMTTEAAVAWEGSNAATEDLGLRLRLYQISWSNPRPEVRIRSIQFRTLMDQAAPFLLAITAE